MIAIPLTTWITQFAELHNRAKTGALPAGDMPTYLNGRTQLANLLLVGQRLTNKPGDPPRQHIRVARAFQIEFEFPVGKVSALTQDLSVGGVSAIVPSSPPVGTRVLYTMKISRNMDPLTGAGKIVNVAEAKGANRIALMFEELSAANRDRIEMAVFDVVLAQLSGPQI